ncbi:MAG: hypothetical protein UV73_C0004G0151 [Candidatus Gottesmanbacteria bacterium GW2011_GWA2_43_14]|uniref:DUF2933 domain-containing protein n=1 Tax=Candidatus Gottesmanbacteria bacterium GW2011_GWA2_43_14 TaxID=1618443 RepID=A0A0G1DK10_9BACT|nr:MAG: hypothetical protein UV73_C0004G0151 [Candidatus Gottesmanbacteria bacterium GW2011_GWA2_43_14]
MRGNAKTERGRLLCFLLVQQNQVPTETAFRNSSYQKNHKSCITCSSFLNLSSGILIKMNCCNNDEKSKQQESGNESNQSPKINPRAKWLYLCGAVLIATFAAVSVFKVPINNLLFYGAILACPILHVFMMKDHSKGNKHHQSPEK